MAIVERLIQAGADVNRALAKTGTSPLHAAAEMDHATIVRLLVAAGADIDKVRAADGAAALYIAAQNGHAVIVEILIAAGVNVDKVSPRPSIAETEAPATRARRASHLSRCACLHSADTASHRCVPPRVVYELSTDRRQFGATFHASLSAARVCSLSLSCSRSLRRLRS